MSIFDEFKTLGLRASYHYADDTASGEWRMGSKLEAQALKMFDAATPEEQDKMREIAKGFLWSLKSKRPPVPYADDPRLEAERRLNRYDESRKLTDGRIKNTLTGSVTPAPNYERESDFPNNVKDENTI